MNPEPTLILVSQQPCQNNTLPELFNQASLYWFIFKCIQHQFLCFLSVSDTVTSLDSPPLRFTTASTANPMNTLSSSQGTSDLKLTIQDKCPRGSTLNFNNSIKFLEYWIQPDRFYIACTFTYEASSTENLCIVPLLVYNEGKSKDVKLKERQSNVEPAEPIMWKTVQEDAAVAEATGEYCM